jgi:hypothetical protein
MKDHRLIDQRSLALGRAIAARLPGHPELVERAKASLARWQKAFSPRRLPTPQEWEGILAGPLDGIIVILTSGDERAIRLCQSSPFTGVLSEQERMVIFQEFADYDAARP